MPPVSSVLENCVVGKEGGGMKASPSAACARGTGRDGPGNSAFQYYCSSENLNAC